MKKLFVFFLLVKFQLLFSQNHNSDSLLKIISIASNDTNKVKTLILLSSITATKNTEMAMQYAYRANKLSDSLKYKKGLGGSYSCIGIINYYKGNLAEALEHHLMALKINEEINDRKGLARSFTDIGIIYHAKADFENAFKYYRKSLNTYSEINYKSGVASCLNNIGLAYYHKGLPDSTLAYYMKALSCMEELQDYKSMATTYNNIANVLSEKENYKEAISYYQKSMDFKKKNGETLGMLESYYSLARMYYKQRDYVETRKHLLLAEEMSRTLGEKAHRSEIYLFLARCDSAEKKFESAYGNYKLHKSFNDSSINENSINAMNELQTKYDTEKKEKENQLLKKQDELNRTQINKQRIIIISSIIGLIMLLFLSVNIYKNYRAKKKAHIAITLQKDKIEKQKIIIEEKNKDITDSINYAKRIQEAILPSVANIHNLFPESFILFKPKDVVSGDFYWFAEKNGKRIVAAADCTGHGVPGAFMSMIGNAFLNEIVNEKGITRPDQILNQLRHNIINALKQSGESGETKDGMDIALITFNSDSSAEFSGAYNPLLILQTDGLNSVIKEVKADKMPIGSFVGQGLPFTNNHIELNKGDTLYIFSDGFADQFGGQNGKKFKLKQLKDILFDLQTERFDVQKEMLEKKFDEWKGNLEQVDDVLLIGIRV